MWVRGSAVLLIALALMFAPMFASATADPHATVLAQVGAGTASRGVAAQDNDSGDDDDDGSDNNGDGDQDNDNESDGSDNGDNGDGEDGDNGDDEDGDNGDGEDEDDGSDNNDDGDDDNENDGEDDDDEFNDNDTVPGLEAPVVPTAAPPTTPTPTRVPVTPTPTPPPTRTPTPVPAPTSEDRLVTAGVEGQASLTGDRVVLKVFGSMPAGITVTLRLVDPAAYPATPGALAGDLLFLLEARDAAGQLLPALPAEASLSVRYADADVAGLDDARVTLGRLDQRGGQWRTAPSLLRDPATNFVAATITEMGVYAVYLP